MSLHWPALPSVQAWKRELPGTWGVSWAKTYIQRITLQHTHTHRTTLQHTDTEGYAIAHTKKHRTMLHNTHTGPHYSTHIHTQRDHTAAHTQRIMLQHTHTQRGPHCSTHSPPIHCFPLLDHRSLGALGHIHVTIYCPGHLLCPGHGCQEETRQSPPLSWVPAPPS